MCWRGLCTRRRTGHAPVACVMWARILLQPAHPVEQESPSRVQAGHVDELRDGRPNAPPARAQLRLHDELYGLGNQRDLARHVRALAEEIETEKRAFRARRVERRH